MSHGAFYVLIDWVRSGGKYQAERGPCALTESQMFYRPARPNSVNKRFITSPLFFLSFSFFGWNEDAHVAALPRSGYIFKEPMILRNLIGKPVKYIETRSCLQTAKYKYSDSSLV